MNEGWKVLTSLDQMMRYSFPQFLNRLDFTEGRGEKCEEKERGGVAKLIKKEQRMATDLGMK